MNEVTCSNTNLLIPFYQNLFNQINRNKNNTKSVYDFSQVSKFYLLKGTCRKLSLTPQRKISRITNDAIQLFRSLRFYQSSSHSVKINIELLQFFIQNVSPFLSYKMLDKIKEKNRIFNILLGGSEPSGRLPGKMTPELSNTFASFGYQIPPHLVESREPNRTGESNYNLSRDVPVYKPIQPGNIKNLPRSHHHNMHQEEFYERAFGPKITNDPFATLKQSSVPSSISFNLPLPKNSSSVYPVENNVQRPPSLSPNQKKQRDLQLSIELLNLVSDLIPGTTSFSLSQFSQNLWFNTPLSFRKVQNQGFHESENQNNYKGLNQESVDFKKRKSIFNTMILSKLILIDRTNTDILPFWNNNYLNELKERGYINGYCKKLLETYLMNIKMSTKQRFDSILEKLEKQYPEYIGGEKNLPIRQGGKRKK